MIVRRGKKYCLLSKKTRRNLGCYRTRKGAEQREREVQYFKHRNRRPEVHVRRHLRPVPSAIRVEPTPHGLRGGVEGTQDVYIEGIQAPIGQYRYTFMTPDSVEIEWVGVRGDYRRMGYGRLIVEKILEDLRAQGVRHVYLKSLPDSVGFWERMGFKLRYANNPYAWGMVKHL